MTVGLDTGGAAAARPWIEAASPEHPSLVDEHHVCDELFGITNVPMAVWIDEDGMIVRPAEPASVEASALRDMEVPDGLPERLHDMLVEVTHIRDDSAAYRDALGRLDRERERESLRPLARRGGDAVTAPRSRRVRSGRVLRARSALLRER